MSSYQEARLPQPQERFPILPVRMAWAKARGSMDELRRYIWNMQKKGREGSKTALLRTSILRPSHSQSQSRPVPSI